MEAPINELGNYEPMPVVDFDTRHLMLELDELCSAQQCNIIAVKSYIKGALKRIIGSCGSRVLTNRVVDDSLWKIHFTGDRIRVRSIYLHVKDAIKIVFRSVEGIVFSDSDANPLPDGARCFDITAPIDEFERFATKGRVNEDIGYDVRLYDMSLSQFAELCDWNHDYRLELYDELHIRLANFFEDVFDVDYNRGLDIVSEAVISMVGNTIVIDGLIPNNKYYDPLRANSEASYCIYSRDRDGDAMWCTLSIPCSWIDEVNEGHRITGNRCNAMS